MNPLVAMRFIIRELEAPPLEKLLMLALLSHADGEGHCFPSVATLAAETGISRRTVQRLLRRLERAGLLRITPGQGRRHPSSYRLALPGKGVTVTPFRPGKGVSDDTGKASPRPERASATTQKRRHGDALTTHRSTQGTTQGKGETRARTRASSPLPEVISVWGDEW